MDGPANIELGVPAVKPKPPETNPVQTWVDTTNESIGGKDLPDVLFSPKGSELKKVEIPPTGLPIEDGLEMIIVGEVFVAGIGETNRALYFGSGQPLLGVERRKTSGGVNYFAPVERQPPVALRPVTATFDVYPPVEGNQYQANGQAIIPQVIRAESFATEIASGIDPNTQQELRTMQDLLSQAGDVSKPYQIRLMNIVVGMSQRLDDSKLRSLRDQSRGVNTTSWIPVTKVLAVYLSESRKT